MRSDLKYLGNLSATNIVKKWRRRDIKNAVKLVGRAVKSVAGIFVEDKYSLGSIIFISQKFKGLITAVKLFDRFIWPVRLAGAARLHCFLGTRARSIKCSILILSSSFKLYKLPASIQRDRGMQKSRYAYNITSRLRVTLNLGFIYCFARLRYKNLIVNNSLLWYFHDFIISLKWYNSKVTANK